MPHAAAQNHPNIEGFVEMIAIYKKIYPGEGKVVSPAQERDHDRWSKNWTSPLSGAWRSPPMTSRAADRGDA